MSKTLFTLAAMFSIANTDGASVISKDLDTFQRPALNDEPMIGILSQEMLFSLERKYPDQYHSYIAASYVKFVEGGGARAVPVW